MVTADLVGAVGATCQQRQQVGDGRPKRDRGESGKQAIEVGVNDDLTLHVQFVLVVVGTDGVGEAIADVRRPAEFLAELLKIVDVGTVNELQGQPVHVHVVEVLVARPTGHRGQGAIAHFPVHVQGEVLELIIAVLRLQADSR